MRERGDCFEPAAGRVAKFDRAAVESRPDGGRSRGRGLSPRRPNLPARIGRRHVSSPPASCPDRGRGRLPGPRRPCRQTWTVTAESSGAALSALEIRLSSTWARRSPPARAATEAVATSSSLTPRSSVGRHASTRPRASATGRWSRRDGGYFVCSSEREQRVHQPRQPVDLGYGGSDPVRPGGVDVPFEVLEPQPKGRQRRAQLVGGIRHEIPLCRDKAVDPSHHVVELQGEAPDSGGCVGDGGACSRSPAPARAAASSSPSSGRRIQCANLKPTRVATPSAIAAMPARTSQ